jgi:hypothetical protein
MKLIVITADHTPPNALIVNLVTGDIRTDLSVGEAQGYTSEQIALKRTVTLLDATVSLIATDADGSNKTES